MSGGPADQQEHEHLQSHSSSIVAPEGENISHLVGCCPTKASTVLYFEASLSKQQQINAQIRGYIAMAIELTLLGTIYGVTNNHEDEAWACDRDMVIWLYVFAGYLGAQFVYDLYYTIVFGYVKRPSEICRFISDGIMFFILYGFAIAWLVYGNVLVWNDAYQCRYHHASGAEPVWRLFVAIIAIGYVFFLLILYIIAILIAQLVTFILLRAGKQPPVICYLLPYIRTLTTAHEGLRPADIHECGICDQKYAPEDQVNYIKCEKRHYFHQQCLKDYLPLSKLCPYCLKEAQSCCSSSC